MNTATTRTGASDDAPVLGFTAGRASRLGDGVWRLTWRITSENALTLEEAWQPHGRFRSDRVPLQLALPAGGVTEIALEVRAREGPSTEVENCFLILVVRKAQGDRWRILARLTVVFDPEPRPIVQAVTAQTIGFAGEGGQA